MNDSVAFTTEVGSGTLSGTVNQWNNIYSFGAILPQKFVGVPISPIVLDGTANNPYVLYIANRVNDVNGNGFGDGRVMRVTWAGTGNNVNGLATGVSTDVISPNVTNGVANGALVTALAISPGDNSRVYAGSSDGAVWMTTNAYTMTTNGPVLTAPASIGWKQVNLGSTPLPSVYVTSILVDPVNQNRVYVTLGGSGVGHLWRCTDVTVTNTVRVWDDLGAGPPNMPDISVNSIAVHPIFTGTTWYLGTDQGVWLVQGSGTSWSSITQPSGLPAVQVNQLTAEGGTGYLNATTYGRGIWRLSVTNAVYAPQIQGFGITPSPLPQAYFSSAMGRVTLWQPAPAGGSTIAINSDHPLVFTPYNLVIPAGQITGTFPVFTAFVSPQTITFSAQPTNSVETRFTTLNIVAPGSTATTVTPTPVIQGISPTADGKMSITWSTFAGRTYRLQYKDDLSAPNWTDLAPDITANGDTTTVTDSVQNAAQRFYRILLVQ
jgi:hypothetical protein